MASFGDRQDFGDAGDLRFAAQLLKHAVFADPGDPAALQRLLSVLDQPDPAFAIVTP